MNPDPSQTLIQVVASLIGVLVLRWLDRRKNRKVQAKAEEAADQATEAAKQGTIAARQSIASTTSSKQAEEAIVLLAREVGRSAEISDRSLAAMHRMAEQNDNWFGAYTTLIALLRKQEERVGRLEQFAAEEETTRYAASTGATSTHGGTDGDY